MSIIIRRIAELDWQQFKEIRIEAFERESQAFDVPLQEARKYPDDYWKSFCSDKRNIIFIAYSNSTPIGLIRAATEDDDTPPGTALIGSFYISESFRGQGIARELFDTLLYYLSTDTSINSARLWVEEGQIPAIKLYKHFGFSQIGKQQEIGSDGKTMRTELIFEKSLKDLHINSLKQ